MIRRFLVEVDTSDAVSDIGSDESMSEWLRETVADGLGPAYGLDEIPVTVEAAGNCAACGDPMQLLVRGHHHSENGVDVTR